MNRFSRSVVARLRLVAFAFALILNSFYTNYKFFCYLLHLPPHLFLFFFTLSIRNLLKATFLLPWNGSKHHYNHKRFKLTTDTDRQSEWCETKTIGVVELGLSVASLHLYTNYSQHTCSHMIPLLVACSSLLRIQQVDRRLIPWPLLVVCQAGIGATDRSESRWMTDHPSHQEGFFGSWWCSCCCCCWYQLPSRRNLCRITRQQHANFSLKPWYELETGGTFSVTCYCCYCNLFFSDHYSVWISLLEKNFCLIYWHHLDTPSFSLIVHFSCSPTREERWRRRRSRSLTSSQNLSSKISTTKGKQLFFYAPFHVKSFSTF